MSRTVKPVGECIAVRAVEQADKTTGGIFLPDTAKEKSQEAVVIAVGPGRTLDNGTVVPCSVKPGQHIIFSKYSGSEMKIDGEDVTIIKDKDVLAIIEPALAGAAK